MNDSRLAEIVPPAWRDTFAAVPRHVFVPDLVWLEDGEGPVPLRRDDDPERWRAVCDSDRPIVTQLDDGTRSGKGYITSSASQPSIVAMMLEATDLAPGHRVLEIGTGTGWNAALLAAVVGAKNVTTVEIDPVVAARARKALEAANLPVVTVVGDGTAGHSAGAPYDRVLSTAAVHHVPYSWVEQTQPGGRIVTPWGTTFHNGVLATLEVDKDGTASGPVSGNTAFMWVRDQRRPHAVVEEQVRPEHEYEETTTSLHPYEPIGSFDARFAIGLRMAPGATEVTVFDDDEPGNPFFTVYLMAPDSGSWTSWRITPNANGAYRVRQHGPRRLFDEMVLAYEWWCEAGKPNHTRFGLTVGPERQSIWLDHSARVVM